MYGDGDGVYVGIIFTTLTGDFKMGYLGLENLYDSDYAVDMAGEIWSVVLDKLKESIDKEANEYNTCGVVNVALFFEAYLLPCRPLFDDNLNAFAQEVIDRLKDLIKKSEEMDWDTDENKEYHIECYKRMIRSIEGWLEENQ